MEPHHSHPGRKLIFLTAYIIAVLSFLIAVGLVIAEAYVRFSLNQNFSFLGGYKLEALMLLTLGLMLGLMRMTRGHKHHGCFGCNMHEHHDHSGADRSMSRPTN